VEALLLTARQPSSYREIIDDLIFNTTQHDTASVCGGQHSTTQHCLLCGGLYGKIKMKKVQCQQIKDKNGPHP
jgi:hypothetical protein